MIYHDYLCFPTTISASAVETPSQIDVRLATSASESHRVASAHTPVMIVLAIGCRLAMDEVDQDVGALANWTFGPAAESSACFRGRNNREETVVSIQNALPPARRVAGVISLYGGLWGTPSPSRYSILANEQSVASENECPPA
jgi:hypothetical protein